MVQCVFCSSEKGEFQHDITDIFGDHWSIFQCSACKAYYLSPFPSPEQFSRAYDETYYGKEDKKFSFPLIEKVLNYFRNSRARNVMTYLKNGNSVLDIGCGNGGFLQSLKNFGDYKLIGSELSIDSAKRALKNKDIEMHIGELKEERFENNSLDLITLFHVFEHLAQPQLTLSIIQKKLKTNGHVVMSFPNIDSWQSKLFKGHWLHLDPPRHLFLFKPSDFILILEDMGFKLIKEKYFSIEQNPFGMIQSILNLFSKKRDVLYESLKGNKEYIEDYKGFKLLIQRIFFMLSFPVFIVTDFIASLFKKSATVELTLKRN